MRTLALAASAFLAPALLDAQQVTPIASDSAIHVMLADRLAARPSGGIVVGVIDPDGRRRVIAHGESGTARPLDRQSVFEIGSVTKTFTGALLADMARRGEVSLTDPVSKYLPSTVKMPSRGGRQITLLDLATQSSGLPRMPNNFAPANAANPYADYTPEQMYAFLSGYALPRDVGAEYEYSNLGVGLLGHALARRAGTDWETVVRRRVTDPLGMRDTRVTLTSAERDRLALGHDEGGAVVPNWDLPTFAGAGALRSTADDMLTYLAANMAADVDSVRGPLAPVLHATHVPRRAGPGAMQIGLAWNVVRAPDGSTLVWHNGGTGGYHSFAAYSAATRTAVVVLANSNNSIDDIGMHLLVPSVPLQSTAPAVARTAITLPAATLDRYVGDYALAPTFHIVVTREGDGLAIQATNQPRLPIFAEGETKFFLKVVDAQITFEVGAAGPATALVLHQGGADQRAPRVATDK